MTPTVSASAALASADFAASLSIKPPTSTPTSATSTRPPVGAANCAATCLQTSATHRSSVELLSGTVPASGGGYTYSGGAAVTPGPPDPTGQARFHRSNAARSASGSNVAVLVSHYDTHFGPATDPATNWVALAELSNYTQLTDTETGEKVANPYKIKKRRQSKRREAQIDADYRLTEPPGPDGLSDEFLSRVGRAYVAASLRREPPNRTIAADVHASPKSVARWVYEARRRGVMPPARARGARG
jgi:hypothetical protein